MTAAAALRALHVPGAPLVLPNAWDAASARAVAEAGFPAVATASAAVSEALGYPDGEAMPVEEAFAAVGRVARAVGVPVTADVERGYGLAAGELVARLAAAGAVGCNLEDSDPRTGALVPVREQVALLAGVRAADGELVVNARVDVFLRGGDDFDAAVRRARAYVAAGADCVYPIGLSDAEGIGRFVREVGAPVNVGKAPGSPSLAELAGLGVARVSYGPGVHRRVRAAHARVLAEIRGELAP